MSMATGARALAFSAVLIAAGCGSAGQDAGAPVQKTGLEGPSESQPLIVATRNAATSYMIDRDEQPSGPEFDRVTAFAEAQGWEVQWEIYSTTAGVLEALVHGKAHMAAAGLSRTPKRDERFAASRAYREVEEQLVCQRGSVRAGSLADLPEDVIIRVAAHTSYAETFSGLQEAGKGPSFETTDAMGSERLLSEVAEGGAFCTVADSTIVAINRRIFPNLDVVLSVGEPRDLVWYAHPTHEGLATTASEWMRSDEAGKLARRIDHRYYDYIAEFDFVDLRALSRSLESKLPKYKPLFEEAARNTNLAPDLLAALSYQESHWNPNARSPTGVRGIMMLTQVTAKEQGVENRLDPQQAIPGGARYLAWQRNRLPEDIAEPDRSYLALAAYNVGRGHLLDARRLAARLGRDPDSWVDMREVLPLLTEPEYYKNLRFGYARGYEPVHYVQRIRNYRDVIITAFD